MVAAVPAAWPDSDCPATMQKRTILTSGQSTSVLLTMPFSANWTASSRLPTQGMEQSCLVSWSAIVASLPDSALASGRRIRGGQARDLAHPLHHSLGHRPRPAPTFGEYVHHIPWIALQLPPSLPHRCEVILDE